MTHILAAVFVQALASIAVAMGLSHYRPRWPKRRLVTLSAAPVPLIFAALSAYLFLKVSVMTDEQCGVDACGYAIIGVVFGAIAAVLLYIFGMGLSAPTVGRTRRSESKDSMDVFS